ncbi:tyrosine-type recombinase/integrase [Bacillus infantis]|uniref:tyrosine-type recombinase/integrase n=1 Tax=Bacillus infantis TaxID=324767 RepID=UPI00321B9A0F
MQQIFPEYVQKYIKDQGENGLQKGTLRRNLSDIAHFLSWIKKRCSSDDLEVIGQLTSQDFQEYIQSIEEKQLSPATIKRRLSVLKGFLRYLDINAPAVLKEGSKGRPMRPLSSDDFVTPKELQKLLRSMRSKGDIAVQAARDFLIDRNVAIVYLLRFYGLTPSLISSIVMNDINLARKTLAISSEGAPKTIELADEHIKPIRDYLKSIDPLLRPRYRSEDPLFVAFNNKTNSFQFDYAVGMPKKLSVRAIQKFLKDEVDRASLRKISSQHLRRTAILDALKSGLPEIVSYFGLSDDFSLWRYRQYLLNTETPKAD